MFVGACYGTTTYHLVLGDSSVAYAPSRMTTGGRLYCGGMLLYSSVVVPQCWGKNKTPAGRGLSNVYKFKYITCQTNLNTLLVKQIKMHCFTNKSFHKQITLQITLQS
jgi:hypothetical protein